MAFKAVVLDMDGTLLNEKQCISDYTAKILAQVQQKGICIIVATGRTYMDVFHNFKKIGVNPDYIITTNGASVHDSQQCIVFKDNIEPSIARLLTQLEHLPEENGRMQDTCCTKKFITTTYSHENCYTDDSAIFDLIKFSELFQIQCIGKSLRNMTDQQLQEIQQIWFLGNPDVINALRMYVNRICGEKITCVQAGSLTLDCIAKGVSKGVAVEKVAALIGVSLSEVACFGDGMNDLSMLRISGKPYLMGNAHPKLREALPFAEVIGTNAEDGVAIKLEELFFPLSF